MRKIPGQAREPIFSPGAPSFFVQLVTLAVALCIVLAVLMLGVFTKNEAHSFLWGTPAAAPAIEPGWTVKRIN